MKKNVMMRLASVLLVCVLLSTSVISGTFAKYVTGATAGDTARVAKWGVTVSTSGTLFAEQYKDAPIADVTDTGENITVQVYDAASVEQDVVAPGTKNDDGMTFEIKGTPEVDTKIAIVLTAFEDIYLEADTYADPTMQGAPDFTIGSDYHPIEFTLVHTTSGGVVTKTGTLETIKNYLEGLSDDRVDANIPLEKTFGTFKLTWAWKYGTAAVNVDNKNITDDDRCDTVLGNAAESSIPGAHTNINFGIDILVEQID